WNLSNGARVILKETANKNNEIVLYALAKGGTGNASAEADISASLASEMMEVSGLGPYTRTELMKMLSDKQVSLGLWLSAYLRGFQGAATAGDIETLFELLYLNFTEPRIDEKAVAAMMDQYRTLLAQRSENPETVFSDEVTRTVYGDNPRFMPMTAEDLPRVSPADARAFLSACLSPGDYTFVFTGNLNIENMRTLTETYLASIPEGQSLNEWADLGVRRPGKTEKTVYKGREEKGLVFMGWYVPETYTDADGAIVSVLNEYLDIKLTQEIRESLGGVYSVSVSVSLTPVPAGELAMGISFSCDPGRADELAAAIENEVEAVAAGTIDGATLEKAIAALKKNFEQSMQSNTYIARNYANYSTIMKLPLGRLEARPSLYEQASPAALREKASALMAGGPVRVTLYPEGR
ncbi:insulinase family protein, partial [Treponema sp. OttesenSCG-928-L16]|nr:insulinase family protein [Treponema sp. OttesenSCG-928-L16]